MAAFVVTLRNYALDQVTANRLKFVSLHTANPGTTGTGELSGGSPAYARQPIAWTAATGGGSDLTATATFDIPGGRTITHYGLWDSLTGGTFQGGEALVAPEAYVDQGLYDLTSVPISA